MDFKNNYHRRNKHTKLYKAVYVNKNGYKHKLIQEKHEESWFVKLVHRVLTYLSK